jgi:hypothetical protein
VCLLIRRKVLVIQREYSNGCVVITSREEQNHLKLWSFCLERGSRQVHLNYFRLISVSNLKYTIHIPSQKLSLKNFVKKLLAIVPVYLSEISDQLSLTNYDVP